MSQNKVQPQTLKGFRDFLPSQMVIRNYVKNTLIDVFEKFGFEPVETPVLEYASVLKGKYSSETDEKLGYFFTDNGDREIGLRYDLTVPISKVLAIYSNQISLPFKRYQIQSVWRADNTQKGRYREFIQCDIDTFGSNSPISDAEIIALIYTATKKLNFKEFTIHLNSRPLLIDILTRSGFTDNHKSVLQSLDKFDKIGENGVKNELKEKGFSDTQISSLFNNIKNATPDQNLTEVMSLLSSFGVPSEFYVFDPTLVRGPDYYTGVIFETSVTEPKIGSIGGGGRYNNLIETLGGPNIPATGYSFGFERLIDVITELNLLPNLPKTKTQILVTYFSADTQKNSLDLVTKLRQNNICATVYPNTDKLGKQFKYADNLNIPFVAVLGPDEIAANKIMLKNMAIATQELVSFDELITHIK